jgi:hypothetical protein
MAILVFLVPAGCTTGRLYRRLRDLSQLRLHRFTLLRGRPTNGQRQAKAARGGKTFWGSHPPALRGQMAPAQGQATTAVGLGRVRCSWLDQRSLNVLERMPFFTPPAGEVWASVES